MSKYEIWQRIYENRIHKLYWELVRSTIEESIYQGWEGLKLILSFLLSLLLNIVGIILFPISFLVFRFYTSKIKHSADYIKQKRVWDSLTRS